MESIFIELSAIIVLSTGLALVAKILKQPIILAFISTGILLGPIGFNIIQSHELIDVMAEFGIALLLYVVGIELDMKKFKALSWSILFVGIGQIIATCAIGWLIGYGLGFSIIESIFIGITLTLSSTIVIVKLLGEKRQLESLYGRITVFMLLLQDFAAIIALLLLKSFAQTTGFNIPWGTIGLLALKTIVIGSAAFILAKYVFRKIFLFIGRSQELLFLWSIAWCVLFAAVAILWNYPIAISVFFAGITIGSLDYNYEIAARIRSLRDFFIVIFFTFLGSELVLNLEPKLLVSAIILALFVLIGNPIIVYIILRLAGHQNRTAVFAGLTMAQISEFSFIIANQGLEQGLITHQLVSMIAVVGLATMILSTYMITYNEKIYRYLEPILRWLPLPKPAQAALNQIPTNLKNHFVIFGYHANVDHLLNELHDNGEQTIVIDYNPDNSRRIKQKQVFYIYGDMRDEDILDLANLESAKMIISIVPYHEPTMSLLQHIKHFNIKSDVVVLAPYLMDVKAYYDAGATFVLHPESISLKYLTSVLTPEQLAHASNIHQKELMDLLENSLHEYGPLSPNK